MSNKIKVDLEDVTTEELILLVIRLQTRLLEMQAELEEIRQPSRRGDITGFVVQVNPSNDKTLNIQVQTDDGCKFWHVIKEGNIRQQIEQGQRVRFLSKPETVFKPTPRCKQCGFFDKKRGDHAAYFLIEGYTIFYPLDKGRNVG